MWVVDHHWQWLTRSAAHSRTCIRISVQRNQLHLFWYCALTAYWDFLVRNLKLSHLLKYCGLLLLHTCHRLLCSFILLNKFFIQLPIFWELDDINTENKMNYCVFLTMPEYMFHCFNKNFSINATVNRQHMNKIRETHLLQTVISPSISWWFAISAIKFFPL
jgi:hypothetical protein